MNRNPTDDIQEAHVAPMNPPLQERLEATAKKIWRDTLILHKRAGETRVASSLSPVELFTVLFYGGILQFRPSEPLWDGRDRMIVSKGHGSICLYPILADLGFFPQEKLDNICKAGSFLGSIPDPIIPGYETVNGSLGHGLGVASGTALALKRLNKPNRVYVLCGDGELFEGAVWEAMMFAGHHRLNNLVCILDYNKICMLDHIANVVGIEPIAQKAEAFGWGVSVIQNGHDVGEIYRTLAAPPPLPDRPHMVIAHTVKGHGVPMLEASPLCHVLTVPPDEIDRILGESA